MNPEHYGHLFAVLSHVNFGGLALITFFYDKIHKNMVDEFEQATTRVESASDAIREVHGLSFRAQNSIDNFLNAIKWVLADFTLFVITPIIRSTERKLFRINNESNYITKYLPYFLYSGLFCVLMLYLSGVRAEHDDAKAIHDCNVFILYTVSIICLFLLVSVFFFYNIRKTNVVILTHLASFITLSVLVYIVFLFINIEWLHEIFPTYNKALQSVIFLLSIFPIIYLILKTVTLSASIKIVNLSEPITNMYANEDMNNILKISRNLPEKKSRLYYWLIVILFFITGVAVTYLLINLFKLIWF